MNSEYFVNPFWRYWSCRSTFWARIVDRVLSIISSSVFFISHSSRMDVIENICELFSDTVRKSWNLRFDQSFLAFGNMTNLWWSYRSFRAFQRTFGSSTVRYSFFRASSKWCHRNIVAFAFFSDTSGFSVTASTGNSFILRYVFLDKVLLTFDRSDQWSNSQLQASF